MFVKVMTIEEYVSVMSARQVPMLPTSPLHSDSEIDTGGLSNVTAIIGWEVGDMLKKLVLALPPPTPSNDGNEDNHHSHDDEDDDEDGDDDEDDDDEDDDDGDKRDNFDPYLRYPWLKEAETTIKGKVFVFWETHSCSESRYEYDDDSDSLDGEEVKSIYLGFKLYPDPKSYRMKMGLYTDFDRNLKELRGRLEPLVEKFGEPLVYIDGDLDKYHDIG